MNGSSIGLNKKEIEENVFTKKICLSEKKATFVVAKNNDRFN